VTRAWKSLNKDEAKTEENRVKTIKVKGIMLEYVLFSKEERVFKTIEKREEKWEESEKLQVCVCKVLWLWNQTCSKKESWNTRKRTS
jgi:hypothetical protein